MRIARAINNLIEAFERLPGVGPKSAARLTYYLLHVPQIELDKFSDSVKNLKLNTKECHICHNISESDPCDICSDTNRDSEIICVVEQPLDVMAFERGGRYKGVYHVLHGVIDPLHNIGPDEIKIQELVSRLRQDSVEPREIILALNPNMEGESTCMYIDRKLKNSLPANATHQALQAGKTQKIKVTRLAHGLPTGADVQYADETTLTRALEDRREY